LSRVKRRHTAIQPVTQPIASDTPLMDRQEAQRAADSLRTFTLTECERMAYIERYGAPTAPYKPSAAFVPNVPNHRRKGKGA
jgi:hypothetical protein